MAIHDVAAKMEKEEIDKRLNMRGWSTNRMMKWVAYEVLGLGIAGPFVFLLIFYFYSGQDFDAVIYALPFSFLLCALMLSIFIPFYLHLSRFILDTYSKHFKDRELDEVTAFIMNLVKKLGLEVREQRNTSYGVFPFRSKCDAYIFIPERKLRLVLFKKPKRTIIRIGRLTLESEGTFLKIVDRLDQRYDPESFREKGEVISFETHDKGEMLYKFRRSDYMTMYVLTLVFVVFALCSFAGMTQSILLREGNVGAYVIFLLLYGLGIGGLSLIFWITTFDNVIIFEHGLYPPIEVERMKDGILKRRTFIPFTEISHYEVHDEPPFRYPMITFRAKGRSWRIALMKATVDLIPIIEEGMANGKVKWRRLEKKSNVRVKQKGAFDWDKCRRCGGLGKIPNVMQAATGKGPTMIPCPYCSSGEEEKQ